MSSGRILIPLVLIAALYSIPAQPRSRKSKLSVPAARATNEAFVKAPVADEVCFAPEEPCDIKLAKFLSSARKSLDIAIFDINHEKLVHEIIAQSKKVPVRLVVDRKEARGGDKRTLVPLLLKEGVSVRFGRQRGIMHNKFAIVDGKIVETGSFNYTNGAAFKNHESQVYLATPAILERYRARFEKLWAEGDVPRQ